jgi:hypothetical protein
MVNVNPFSSLAVLDFRAFPTKFLPSLQNLQCSWRMTELLAREEETRCTDDSFQCFGLLVVVVFTHFLRNIVTGTAHTVTGFVT